MYKKIKLEDITVDKIYLKAITFAARVLEFVCSTNEAYKELKEERVKPKNLLKEFTVATAELVAIQDSLRANTYTESQRKYVTCFGGMILWAMFTDDESFEKLEKERENFKSPFWIIEHMKMDLFYSLQKYDKNWTKVKGKIREDVPELNFEKLGTILKRLDGLKDELQKALDRLL